MRQIKPEIESFARIRVVGTGGSGSNAINHMIKSKVKGVDFVAINTDAQDLHHSSAKQKVHIGKELTRGLGSGMNAEVGKAAAEEQLDEIKEALQGSDMVFITCGMGGGTGTGSAPVIANAARELGALTIGIVTLPFGFEGQHRLAIANEGLNAMRQSVDAIVVISNDKILETVPKETGIKEAFATCDDVLRVAVEGISDLITKQGIINVDFADIRTIMESSGSALMGIGEASGEDRATKAALNAINSPLLDVSIDGATGVLIAISGKDDLGMHEVQEAADAVIKAADPNAKIIFGTIDDDTLKKGAVKVTVIATGFGDSGKPAEEPWRPQALKDAPGQHEGRSIHNTVTNPHAEQSEQPLSPMRSSNGMQPKQAPINKAPKNLSVKKNEAEDDDDFSMIPHFLRRSKLR